MKSAAGHGSVARFRQFGTFSFVICAVLGVATAALAFVAPHSIVPLGLTSVVGFICAWLFATLTIEVDDTGVRWFFTGGLFGSGLRFEEIGTTSARTISPKGWGYRIGRNKRLWFVTGNHVLSLRLEGSNMEYQIGTDDPEAVREEIERRRAHR